MVGSRGNKISTTATGRKLCVTNAGNYVTDQLKYRYLSEKFLLYIPVN